MLRKIARIRIFIAHQILILIILWFPLSAQTPDDEIRTYIDKLEKNEIDVVRKALPELIAKYQNNPGIIYLQGRLSQDGIEAVKFYQSVVDNFPQSEWADDALYKTYQYYYALGLYRTAELKLQQLKKDYPQSIYVSGKTIASIPKMEEETVKLPTKESTTPQQQSINESPSPKKEPYTLQVGAFSTAANAEKQKNFFEELGHIVEITNKVRGGKSLYLVWVGSFSTAEETQRFAKEVRKKYSIDCLVIERY